MITVITDPWRAAALRRRDSTGRKFDVLELPVAFFESLFLDAPTLKQFFEVISSHLAGLAPAHLRSRIVLFTCHVDPDDQGRWDALISYPPKRKKGLPREVLLAWLVLAFPEVSVCALNRRRGGVEGSGALPREHFLGDDWSAVFAAGYEPHELGPVALVPALFDPFGLRNRVKQLAFASAGVRYLHGDCVANRQERAAAIDEEGAYAYLNAFAGYRLGYRTTAVTSARAFKQVFGGDGLGYALVFEDLYLNFPDRREVFDKKDLHLSDLRVRDTECPKLTEVSRRVLVTIGHHRGLKGRRTWRANLAYLRESGVRYKVVNKPTAGLYRLWRDSGLWRRTSHLPRYSKPFHWPPKEQHGGSDGESGHSAPGRLLAISTQLVARAEALLRTAESVEDAVHAAVLALEAKELLACRTPTTALEALGIQHEAEVVAESMFLGVEHNIRLKERFSEIKREVTALGKWYHPSARGRSEINARLAIVDRLAKRFSDLHQIEEELACLTEARRLRFKFWTHQRWWRRIFSPLLAYISTALSSLPLFIALVFLWAVFFGLSYWAFAHCAKLNESLWTAMVAAAKMYFTGESADGWVEFSTSSTVQNWWNLWVTFQGVVSFTNLGLLISHLYLIVSRR